MILHEDFDRLAEALDPAARESLFVAATEHIPAYTEVLIDTGPGTLGAELWPCFVESICADHFFPQPPTNNTKITNNTNPPDPPQIPKNSEKKRKQR